MKRSIRDNKLFLTLCIIGGIPAITVIYIVITGFRLSGAKRSFWVESAELISSNSKFYGEYEDEIVRMRLDNVQMMMKALNGAGLHFMDKKQVETGEIITIYIVSEEEEKTYEMVWKELEDLNYIRLELEGKKKTHQFDVKWSKFFSYLQKLISEEGVKGTNYPVEGIPFVQ